MCGLCFSQTSSAAVLLHIQRKCEQNAERSYFSGHEMFADVCLGRVFWCLCRQEVPSISLAPPKGFSKEGTHFGLFHLHMLSKNVPQLLLKRAACLSFPPLGGGLVVKEGLPNYPPCMFFQHGFQGWPVRRRTHPRLDADRKPPATCELLAVYTTRSSSERLE